MSIIKAVFWKNYNHQQKSSETKKGDKQKIIFCDCCYLLHSHLNMIWVQFTCIWGLDLRSFDILRQFKINTNKHKLSMTSFFVGFLIGLIFKKDIKKSLIFLRLYDICIVLNVFFYNLAFFVTKTVLWMSLWKTKKSKSFKSIFFE